MGILKKVLDKLPSFSSSGKRSLAYLNATQSLGVINDNIFKFSMAFLLIDTLGKHAASSVLSATGAIYVIPFLLFSSSAGILADRYSKQKLLVLMKGAEVILMILTIITFATKTVWGCYTLLFFLSIHSALFSPSKYGIIAELVPKESVSKANGLITSFTYLSIIVGTFLASFLTEVTDRHFVLIAGACLLIAVVGLVTALGIRSTKAQNSDKKVNFLFIREILRTLQYTRSVRHLLPSIIGSAFFLLIGAFTQLNIIPFAISVLQLNQVAGGYLFLATAFGIAFGAFIAGRASKKKVELGLSCFSGIGISVFFFSIFLFSSNLFLVILSLFLIGVFGGSFIVPFDTFTQLASRDEKRGQTIAAANFLGFFGVLVASFLLYFLNTACSFSPSTSFAIMGGLTLLASLSFIFRLFELFLSYFSKKVFCPYVHFIPPSPESIEKLKNPFFILEDASWSHILKLSASLPSLQLIIPKTSRLVHFYHRFCDGIALLPKETQPLTIVETAVSKTQEGRMACLVLDKKIDKLSLPQPNHPIIALFKKDPISIYFVRFSTDPVTHTTSVSFHRNHTDRN